LPTSHHNWWQVKTALEKQGWKEILTYEDKMLYFQKGNKKIGYEKSNNMTLPYTMTLLKMVEIDYEEFVELYTPDES
jgi:hypothetical protein